MQKYKNQRVFPCIFEQKTIFEQIDLILAHCVLPAKKRPATVLVHEAFWPFHGKCILRKGRCIFIYFPTILACNQVKEVININL